MTPFFSVIIPLYNKEEYIENTLTSVLNQTFSDFEIIIINDGSTDKSKQLAQQFNDTRIHFIDQNNEGVSVARNNGIKQSRGEFIALLDADDFWYPNHLYEQKRLIEQFPNAGLFCSNYEINYKDDFIKPARFNFEFSNSPLIVKDYFMSSIINSVAWTSSTVFTKISFDALGKFNPELRTGQDIDLWIRYALSYDVAFNPQITMRYNIQINNSLSKKDFNIDRYKLVSNFSKEELTNLSLKKYLDINRYAIALRCKLNNEIALYKKLREEIDYSNINIKQKIILTLPITILRTLKQFQKFLIKNQIYTSAYS